MISICKCIQSAHEHVTNEHTQAKHAFPSFFFFLKFFIFICCECCTTASKWKTRWLLSEDTRKVMFNFILTKVAHSCKTGIKQVVFGSSLMWSWLAYICISCYIMIYLSQPMAPEMAGIGFVIKKDKAQRTIFFFFHFSLIPDEM